MPRWQSSLLNRGSGLSGASTNSAAAAIGAAPGEDSLDEAEAEKPAAPDEPLVEAEHILVDYLSRAAQRESGDGRPLAGWPKAEVLDKARGGLQPR